MFKVWIVDYNLLRKLPMAETTLTSAPRVCFLITIFFNSLLLWMEINRWAFPFMNHVRIE